VGRALHEANLPDGFAIDEFDWERLEAHPGVTTLLFTSKFTVDTQNVVLLGLPSTGKTHLATCIGWNAVVQHGKRARYFAATELSDYLQREMESGQAGVILAELRRVDLVIVDGLGCKPLNATGRVLLFQLLSALNGHTSVVVTTHMEPFQWSG